MANNEKDLKLIIASNIARSRKAARLTQAEFAEKLNYTDKAISKWERGESLPDIVVLARVAELFGTTVDDLITERPGSEPIPAKAPRKVKLYVPFLSAGLVWLLATTVFVILALIPVPKAWLAFIFAVPASFIVLQVFNALWGRRMISGILISLLSWSLITAVVLTCTFPERWLLFLIGIPFQILIVLWYLMKTRRK